MLSFNGKPLPAGIRLEGYTLTTPKIQQWTVDVPQRLGVIRVGRKIGNRVASLRLTLWGETFLDYAAAAEAISNWAYSDGLAPLILPGREHGYLLAECTAYPSPDMGAPYKSFDVDFTAPSPEFIAAAASRVGISGSPRIGGTLETPVRLECAIPSALSSPSWTIGGHTMQLSGSVDAGALVLDSETGVVTLDGDDVTSMLTLASDTVFTLPPGSVTIAAPTGVTGTLSWRDRWL